MTTSRLRTALAAGALALSIGALAMPALCQDRAAAATGNALAMAQAERPLPVRIDPAARYLFVVPGSTEKSPDPAEAQRILDALERQGFRMVHERKATARSMADGVRRVIAGGVRPESISVLSVGDAVQGLIDVAQEVYDPRVNYIIIAGCTNRPNFASRVPLKGRVLSVQMEKPAGPMASCRSVFVGRGAASGFEFEEIAIRNIDSGPTYPVSELVVVEAINAWTRSHHTEDVR